MRSGITSDKQQKGRQNCSSESALDHRSVKKRVTRHFICSSHHRRTDSTNLCRLFKHSHDPKSHFTTVLISSIVVNTQKKTDSKYSDHVPPAAPVVLQISVTVKGPHAGPNLLCGTSPPVCLSKQQCLTDNTTGEQSLWVTQNKHIGYSESCRWMKCNDTHKAWDEDALDMKKHRHQAEYCLTLTAWHQIYVVWFQSLQTRQIKKKMQHLGTDSSYRLEQISKYKDVWKQGVFYYFFLQKVHMLLTLTTMYKPNQIQSIRSMSSNVYTIVWQTD